VVAVTARITAVVVSFSDPAATLRAIDSLLAQTLPPLEVVVVDNDPAGAAASAIADLPSPDVRTLHPGENLGYTVAANLAAAGARGEWLFFLNPDASAECTCLERLVEAIDGPDVAIVGAQVLLPDGRVNAGANPVNIAGVSWSGGYGGPREHGLPRDTAAVSGAALLVRREPFVQAGGLCPAFNMYVDDTDLAWRMRLSGMRVRYQPEAVVVHRYEFDKGTRKWFYLERNREWAVLSNLELRTLLLLSPVLLATEVAVTARAASHGWLREKLRAWGSLLRHLPELVRWRSSVQSRRRASDGVVLSAFAGGLETELIETPVPACVNRGMEAYRRAIVRLLGQ
jgi:GT2 family glycosyltransferase